MSRAYRSLNFAAAVAAVSLVAVLATVLIQQRSVEKVANELTLTSSWQPGGMLTAEQTCSAGFSPAFTVTAYPPETESFAYLVESESGEVHWLVSDVSKANLVHAEGARGEGTTYRNFQGNFSYTAPCPTQGEGTYRLTLFALRVPSLELTSGADSLQALTLIRRNSIASQTITVRATAR